MPDVGVYSAPGVVAPVQPDPIAVIRQKIAAKKPLTSDEAVMASKLTSKELNDPTVTNADLAAQHGGMPPQSAPPKPVPLKPPSALQNIGASLKDVAQPILAAAMGAPAGPSNNPGVAYNNAVAQSKLNAIAANPTSSPSAGMGNTSLPPAPGPALAPGNGSENPPPMPVPEKTIPTISKGPVTATIEQASPIAAAAVNQPVSKDAMSQGVDYIAKFLSSNPEGLTLGNILDAVGVAFSAKGGVQRQTQLQQTLAMQRQLAMQQALAQQGYGQQNAMQQAGFTQEQKMANINQTNALQMAKVNLQNEIARAQAEGKIALANDLQLKMADLNNELTKMGVKPLVENGGQVAFQNRWVSSVGK